MTNDGRVKTKVLAKPQQSQAVVQWKGEPITITFQDVKSLLCPLATDQEVAVFLKTCQSLQLNPFANECFLIKYDERDKAAFVIAIDSYLKAAETNKEYDGCEAGVILKEDSGKLEYREGAFVLHEEKPKLVGGWAKVYRRDRGRPTFVAVNKAECIKMTRFGKPTQFWSEEKQPWMLRKTALKRALVEAFPSLFAGTLATADIAPDDAEYRVLEGEMPPAFQNGDTPDWPKFWARAKDELGLTEDKAHELLQVDSIKQLLEQGWDMEQVWTELVQKVGETVIREAEERKDIVEFSEPIDEESVELFDDSEVENPIDMEWLRESLETLNWADVGKWLREKYKATGPTVKAMVESLSREQQEEFVKEAQRRLEATRQT